jgi:hypothetical protein
MDPLVVSQKSESYTQRLPGVALTHEKEEGLHILCTLSTYNTKQSTCPLLHHKGNKRAATRSQCAAALS